MILISKCDLIDPATLARTRAMLRAMNHDARLLEVHQGQVPLEALLDTGRFDFVRAQLAPGWMKALRGEHTPETEEYGISSFVYRARRPFHPARLSGLLGTGLDGVIRSKGFFWLASRMDWVGELSTVGGATTTAAAGFWYAARQRVDQGLVGCVPAMADVGPYAPLTARGWQQVQAARWSAPLPDQAEVGDAREYAAMRRLWHPLWGDRRQELAVIGVDMDTAAVRAQLDACVLDDAEFAAGPDAWQSLPDPFPHWQR